jgi:hypothetical protein
MPPYFETLGAVWLLDDGKEANRWGTLAHGDRQRIEDRKNLYSKH